MPALDAAGISYYNPQVDTWSPDLVNAENDAKQRAQVLLFVVSNQTRGVASMVEVAELVGCGREVVLVIQDILDNGTINGTVSPWWCRRGRACVWGGVVLPFFYRVCDWVGFVVKHGQVVIAGDVCEDAWGCVCWGP